MQNVQQKKICLILSSSLEFSPYVNNYLDIFSDQIITIIEWNRLKIKRQNIMKNTFTYEEKSSGHQKTFLKYLKYYKFIKRILKKKKYDLFVVFGIQMSFFLKSLLKGKKYIIDIRDYHFFSKLPPTKKVLSMSKAIVISSKAYTNFLPKHDNILINHNFNIYDNEEIKKSSTNFFKDMNNDRPLTISTIGANRDFDDSIKIIEQIRSQKEIVLYYHGQSSVNEKLKKYCTDNEIYNVIFSGFYEKKEERDLYKHTHLVIEVRNNNVYNNALALPNKLYNSALYYKPILTNAGSYFSQVVIEYDLGMVFENHSTFLKDLQKYLSNFSLLKFLDGREKFLEKVIQENNIFREYIKNTIK